MKTNKPCGLHCIKIKNISVKVNDMEILSDVNLHIHCGKLTVIIGKNGAGKSTLLKAILGEIDHTGTIEFKDIKSNTFKDLKIGYVPQSLNIDKNTPTSVYDLIASYQSHVPVFFKKSKKAYKNAKEQLKLFGAENLIDKNISTLSGGELQRVLLAISTSPMPNLLVLDEPVSGIDRNGISDFYEIINQLKRTCDLSIILVSHDLDFVAKYADEIILLDHKVICRGPVETVYESNAFLQTFGHVAYPERGEKNANCL